MAEGGGRRDNRDKNQQGLSCSCCLLLEISTPTWKRTRKRKRELDSSFIRPETEGWLMIERRQQRRGSSYSRTHGKQKRTRRWRWSRKQKGIVTHGRVLSTAPHTHTNDAKRENSLPCFSSFAWRPTHAHVCVCIFVYYTFRVYFASMNVCVYNLPPSSREVENRLFVIRRRSQ